MSKNYFSSMSSDFVNHTDKISIRLAQGINDVDVIVNLAGQTWGPTYSQLLSPEQLNYMFQEIYNPASITRQMSDGQQFLLLFHRDKPAGFASYSQLSGGTVYKLNKLYVAPHFHGYGYGKLLIATVQEKVLAAGGQVLELNVNRQNKAKNFYEKCGFSVVRQEDIPIGPFFMNDYVLQKNLKAAG